MTPATPPTVAAVRAAAVKLHRNKKTGKGYTHVLVMPVDHDADPYVEVLTLYVERGEVPGRWYVYTRHSGQRPTGRGREGYPDLAAVRADIARWLADPDDGSYWS